MLENYYKRRSRRRFFNALTILVSFFPPLLAFISWLYVVISLKFSPLNVISTQASLNLPWYLFPGYFSTDWDVTLTEDDSLNDGITDIHYHVKVFHGPLISKHAFDEPLSYYQRIYPVVVRFEMTDESKKELEGKNVDFDMFLSWTGRLTTKYSNYMWSFDNSQNLLARYNINNVGLNFSSHQSDIDSNHTTITFNEKWTLLGHKNFRVDWKTEHLHDPNSLNEIEYFYGMMQLEHSEPRSNLTFKAQSVFQDGVAMDLNGRFSDFFTNRFAKLHRFDISEILTGLIGNDLFKGVTIDYVMQTLDNAIHFTHPKLFDVNVSIAGHEFEDYVHFEYDQKNYFTLRGHVSHPLAFRLFDAFSELENKYK